MRRSFSSSRSKLSCALAAISTTRAKTLGIRKVPARKLPHIAHRAVPEHLPQNFHKIEILVVKSMTLFSSSVTRMASIIGSSAPHDRKRLCKLSGALFEDFVRTANLLLGSLPDLKNAVRGPQDGGPHFFRFPLD